jgi:uncharacterized membrane protein YhaH (DUF805 family)
MGLVRLLFYPNGRIGRAWYWLGLVLELVFFVLGLVAVGGMQQYLGLKEIDDSPLLMIAVYALLALNFSVSVVIHAKRFHDRGRSGWWQLVSFIPFGGLYVLIVCGFLPGDEGPNAYGPDPRQG